MAGRQRGSRNRMTYGGQAWQSYWNGYCRRLNTKVSRNLDKMYRIQRTNAKYTRKRQRLGCGIEMRNGERLHFRAIRRRGRPRRQ